MDVAQLNLQNSRERDYDEYVDLFSRVDERFKILYAKQPLGSVLSIIEVVWDSMELETTNA